MKRLVKNLFDAAIRARGYELKKTGSPIRGYAASLHYAKARGLSPNTVFDVGVGRGTPWLYDAFPNSKLVLFEPLSIFDRELDAIAAQHNADVHRVALAAEAGTAVFNANTAYPTSSSLLELDSTWSKFAAKVQTRHRFEKQTVVVDTLDHLNSYQPPFVLKLDVEGAEIRVLQGAKDTLAHTDLLLMEISVMRRLAGESSFAETIAFLDEWGFELFDIPSLSQATEIEQLIYLDAAFVPKNSQLWPQ